MTSPPVALGLVGCGRLSETAYLPALIGMSQFTVSAVADPDPARSARVAALAGTSLGRPARSFASLADMLEGVPIDAVLLASPAAAHVADAALAAGARLPVLVEKPPAPDAVGAAELAALEPRPWVGFNRRFDAGVTAVRRAIAATGEIHVDLRIHYRRSSWSAYQVTDDALLDLGPHLVDLARWLSDAEVVAVTEAVVDPRRARLELSLERGRASIRVATNRPYHEVIHVRDGTGRPLAHHERGGLRRAIGDRVRRRGATSPLIASLRHQLQAFAQVVLGGLDTHPTLGTAADGLTTMQIIDTARATVAGHKPGQPDRV